MDIRHISLPVFACDRLGDKPKQICGTAFAIGGGVFLTAGHVVRTVFESAVPTLGFVPNESSSGPTLSMNAPITDHEIIDELDLGIVACAGGPYIALPWYAAEAPLLTQILACGYPYALSLEHNTMFVRNYRGHVVASRPLYQFSAQPAGYELSIAAPRGLSGAPVLREDSLPLIMGCVVGNERSGMLVHSDTERDTTSGKEMVVERYEWLTYGVAVSSTAIMSARSRILNSTIRAHLQKHELTT